MATLKEHISTLKETGEKIIERNRVETAKKTVAQPGRRTMADVAVVAKAKADDQGQTLLTAPFRAPSFRDLQRSCAFLQGRLSDAISANAALSEANESLRAQSKDEATFTGKLSQDVAAAEASARASDAAHERDTMRLQDAAIRNATIGHHAQQLEQRLLEAGSREERLMSELRAAREEVAAARADVADLRAESAGLQQNLRQCEGERDESLAHLAATQSQLSAARRDLSTDRQALSSVRAEAEDLHEQCTNAARALQAARSANAALSEQCHRSEQEASALASRAQVCNLPRVSRLPRPSGTFSELGDVRSRHARRRQRPMR